MKHLPLLAALTLMGCTVTQPNQLALIYLDRGAAALAEGRVQEADDACEVSLEYHRDFAEALNCMGMVRLAQGREADAVKFFKKAIAVKDDFLEGFNNLAKVYLDRKDYHLACPLFEQATEIDPGYAVARRNLGTCMLHWGKPVQAATAFRKCLLVDAGFCDCRMGLGAIAVSEKRIMEAARQFEAAIKICPDSPEAHYNACWSYYQLGECSAAVAACERALLIQPGYLEAKHNRSKAAECALKQQQALQR